MKSTIIILITVFLAGCTGTGSKTGNTGDSSNVFATETNDQRNMDDYDKGTYGYDVRFLNEHGGIIELKNEFSDIAVSPKYQGRVMTSSSNGYKGRSYGWINYELIQSGEVLKQFNPVGGEERFWLGPEGGQYSLFFKPGTDFDFENWNTPAAIDTDPFGHYETTGTSVVFHQNMKLRNYSDFEFSLSLVRQINLLEKNQIAERLDMVLPASIRVVGYETVNEITNTGSEHWKKETGLISVWLLGMFNPSPEVTMIIPYRTGVTSEYIVKDDYFGKIPSDRLKTDNGFIFFRGDGRHRGKIGVPPQRALPVMGSYDSGNKVLTIIKTTVPEGVTSYVNSAWEHQEFPYKGDAINAYNDGPLDTGGQLGPFYELESSSPALDLAPRAAARHIQLTCHFEGSEEKLDSICRQVLNISIEKIKNAF